MALAENNYREETRVYGFLSFNDGAVDEVIAPDFAVNKGFYEGQKVHFLLPKGAGWSFHIDDEPLQQVDSPQGLMCPWSPGFFAGEVTAQLIDPSEKAVATYLLDVSPNPNKLGRDIFQQMLDEIWAFDPELVLGTEPTKIQVGQIGNERSRLLAFIRLRRYGPSATEALAQISHAPITALQSNRDHMPIHKVRRADRQTAIGVLRTPELLDYLVGVSDKGVARLGATVDVPDIEPHLDSAANRCITAMGKRLLRTAINLREKLEEDVNADVYSETRSQLAPRWPVRKAFLDGWIKKQKSVLKCTPYIDVTREEITAAGLNAVSAHPLYAKAYRYSWLAQRIGMGGQAKTERLWMNPTWEVYENWCYVHILTLLKSTYSAFAWSSFTKHSSSPLAASQASDDMGTMIRLFLQPNFVPGDSSANREFRSISGKRIPDIVLTIQIGDQNRWFIFDAKYRSHREGLLDGMASAHIYHDALRWNGDQPDAALLLAPSANGVDWLRDNNYQKNEKVGVVVTSNIVGNLQDYIGHFL